MFGSVQSELDFACELLRRKGAVMHERFHGAKLRIKRKSDGSKVTDLDELLSEEIVEEYGLRGIKVVSEEGGTAPYGARKVIVIDPVDGTDDSIEGQERRPRVSLAMISIGMLTDKLVMGAVCAPLLGGPTVLYGGIHNVGAFREINGKRVTCKIDTKPEKGVVLMSSKVNPKNEALSARLVASGLVPLRLHGAVFKACTLIDPDLLDLYKSPSVQKPKLPIVGFITGGHLHDIAGTVPIARGAGAFVTSRTGGAVDLGTGRGCIMANNENTHRHLLELVNQ